MMVYTYEELASLPADTVILDADQWAWQKHADPDVAIWIPAALTPDQVIIDSGPELPVTVLWQP